MLGSMLNLVNVEDGHIHTILRHVLYVVSFASNVDACM